ncbi:MAG: hypothetical protein QW568_02130 [Candidatus Anstonellaceae archaeon]
MGRLKRSVRGSHKATHGLPKRAAKGSSSLSLSMPKLLAAFLSFLVLLGGCTAPAPSKQAASLPEPPNASEIASIVNSPAQNEGQLLPSQVTKLPSANEQAKLPPLPPPPEPPIAQPIKPEEISQAKATVAFYYSPFCPYSARLRPILDSLKEKYGRSVEWEYIDATSEDGFKQFDSMLRENGLSAAYRAVPFVTIGKEKFIGIDQTSTEIEPYLDSLLLQN